MAVAVVRGGDRFDGGSVELGGNETTPLEVGTPFRARRAECITEGERGAARQQSVPAGTGVAVSLEHLQAPRSATRGCIDGA